MATWTTGHTDSVWKMVQLADGRLVTASYDHTPQGVGQCGGGATFGRAVTKKVETELFGLRARAIVVQLFS